MRWCSQPPKELSEPESRTASLTALIHLQVGHGYDPLVAIDNAASVHFHQNGQIDMPSANERLKEVSRLDASRLLDQVPTTSRMLITTLVTAVTNAGLGPALSAPNGPYTVFAPTNDAFAKLPAGTVDTLLKPESKAALTGVLTYHVVPGNVSAAALTKMIRDGGGKATLKTAAGGTLTAAAHGGGIMLTDARGGTSMVTTADVRQSNGVVHVIDGVLLP